MRRTWMWVLAVLMVAVLCGPDVAAKGKPGGGGGGEDPPAPQADPAIAYV